MFFRNSSICNKVVGAIGFLLFIILFFPGSASASFTEVTTANLMGVYLSSVAWGDYDNDGDLDILLSGYNGGNRFSIIYNFDGDFTFTDISAGLPGLANSSASWGDYDNDGDLDILLTGDDGATVYSKVYRNNGDGTFTDISAGLTGVTLKHSASWGDYDNDGDLDILLTGWDSASRISKVYRNNGNATFTDISAGLPGLANSSASWGDYDNDGDLDILLTGYDSATRISNVYRNNGDGTFSDISAGLTGVSDSSTAWGDYDNDGDLDILLTGFDGTTSISVVYRNNGDGTFTDISAGLTGIYYGSVAWGDYDNDGDPDILLTGQGDANRISALYRNNGDGTFTDISAGLTWVNQSSAVWGDFDNDGDLDILLSGDDGTNPITKIYRNDGLEFNQPPGAPTGLIGTQDGATNYNLSWQAPTSTTAAAQVKPAEKTPLAGLNYNLYIGTTSGAIDVTSPMSDLTSGFRRIPLMGLVRGTTSMIKGLSANTLYYWSVQAIDTALAGGPFASEGCFRLNNQVPVVSDVTKTGASPMTFSEADFQGGFSDADSDAMAVVRIVTLPDAGGLLLSGQAVTANDEIAASDLANLTYQAPDGAAAGQATFTWQGRDCTDWSADPAKMILNYTRDAGGGGGGGGGGCFTEVAFDS